jgi:hypothetical protein
VFERIMIISGLIIYDGSTHRKENNDNLECSLSALLSLKVLQEKQTDFIMAGIHGYLGDFRNPVNPVTFPKKYLDAVR